MKKLTLILVLTFAALFAVMACDIPKDRDPIDTPEEWCWKAYYDARDVKPESFADCVVDLAEVWENRE